MKAYRLVVLGSGGVGKSSLVGQFINGFFSYSYQPTIEDNYRHLVQLPDGAFHNIEILDTAGLHQFPAMRELNVKTGQAFVVVYAINDEQSYVDALSLVDMVFQTKGTSSLPIILVGNKIDEEDGREVSKEDAGTAAEERNCAFIETSAKFNLNVDQVFSKLVMKAFETSDMAHLRRRRSSTSKSLRTHMLRLDSVGESKSQSGDEEKPPARLLMRRRSSGRLGSLLRRNSDGDNNNEDASKCVIL